MDTATFVRHQTRPGCPPLVPELRLHLATAVTPLWEATEESLAATGTPPPYWAFAWAGGQALARLIIDQPNLVAGRSVVDVGSGSGLVALAAARSGAARVEAADIDPFAVAAIALNATLNGLSVAARSDDLIGRDEGWATVLVGDLCYERSLAERLVPWLRGLAARGADVLLSDPGRAYLPTEGMVELARYAVPVDLELEDRLLRDTAVFRLGVVG
ncbi:nicotinamide N-methylase [Allostella humosa]|nr:50S ribosomal protein L11 methyltransferase [Stella humosa]BBK34524.1 nicotinamide N-methylase [Stella humosa]